MVPDPEELAAALREQREELHATLVRVAELEGPAREDVFLRARRLLAVHTTLDRLLSSTAGTSATPSFAAEVAAAEALDHSSSDFHAAVIRLAAAHGRASLPAEVLGEGLVAALPEADLSRVAGALRLARGEGDAYLGNTYAEMLAAAEEQLAHPDPAPVEPQV